MEGTVAQLSDGRVMMNIRNKAQVHRRAVAYSPDGVMDWTVPKFDPQLPEPICFGSLLAVPRKIVGREGVLLFSNPNNVARSVDIGPKHYCDRRSVTVKLSLNDGTDWPESLVIEPGFSGYSDLCVAPGTIRRPLPRRDSIFASGCDPSLRYETPMTADTSIRGLREWRESRPKTTPDPKRQQLL
jgi:sialidase-1